METLGWSLTMNDPPLSSWGVTGRSRGAGGAKMTKGASERAKTHHVIMGCVHMYEHTHTRMLTHLDGFLYLVNIKEDWGLHQRQDSLLEVS